MDGIADQLVIETAAAACSVALIRDGAVIACRHDAMARGHAERLLPIIAELPMQGRARSVLVDCGPGSFTGVRVGLAAARALGFAWGVAVEGYQSLDLIATAAATAHPAMDRLLVVIIGGHGEWFVQPFERQADGVSAVSAFRSLTPAAAVAAYGAWPLLAGNAANAYRALSGEGEVADAMMDARDAVMLSPAMIIGQPAAIYGRAPDAKPLAAA